MKKTMLIASILVAVMAGAPAAAETENYLFLIDQSTVVQTGGFPGVNETYQVTGQFQLTVDFTAQTALFNWVDATLSDGPFRQTPSLGQLFNMTELTATTVGAAQIEFDGTTADGTDADIHLVLSLSPGSIHLTGQITSPCCDFFDYSLDAVAIKVPPGWTYQYFDDFRTTKAETDSYTHSVFWPKDAFPPPEPYLYYYGAAGDRALAFADYRGQPAHLGYCFPIASAHARRTVKGILKIDVQFPSNAHISQSPSGYLLYSLSPDGHNWSTPGELHAGHNEIPIESLQGTCYVIFLGTRVLIDNLAVHLNSPPATIHVPADYPTIQDAINAAAHHDVIEVAPDTYKGPGNRDIEFAGKAITVRSANGPEVTIIDCEDSSGPGGPGAGKQHRGFYFHQAENADSVLRGFTIINGTIHGSQIPPDDMRWNLNPSHPIGAGIYCEYSSPTIVDCVVRDCGTEIGGGIGCVGGEPAIIDCLIEQCSAGGFGPADSGGRGGAIGLIRGANAKINNSVIRNNTVYHNGLGAAIYARRAAAAITNCEISSNGPRSEDGFSTGGGLYCSDPQTRVGLRNCIFSNNAAVAGAAVFTRRGPDIPGCPQADCPPCYVRMTNCTVAHNRLVSIADAAIQSAGSDIIVKNSIVYYNEGIQIHLTDPPANSPVVYCDVQGGYPGAGNIDAQPLFAPTGVPDYHLQSIYGRYSPQSGQWVIDTSHSPCIDAGDPKDPVAHEPLPNGRRINMGAYGGTPQASKGRARLVFHVDRINGSDSNNGLSKENAFATIQKGIDSSRDRDFVMVWPAVYVEDVAFRGKAITVQSAADAAVVVAETAYAFSFFTAEGAGSVLRNFVITGSRHAGIFCDNWAAPTLTNLTVAGNGYGIVAWEGTDPNISNCIFWDNDNGDLFELSHARYSCLEEPRGDEIGNISENPLFAEGNIDEDPCFADPSNGDYHLRSRFGRYDPDRGLWIIDDQNSPCIDAGDPQVYPARERMPNGGRLNMGAYGGTPYASKSKWPLRADIDRDGLVNLRDFALVADPFKGDINNDGLVNISDFVFVAENWLQSLPWAQKEWAGAAIVMPMDGSVIPAPRKYRRGL